MNVRIKKLLLSCSFLALFSYLKGKELIINVDQNSFNEQVLQSKTPTVVMFHANWCAACKQMDPIENKLAMDNSEPMMQAQVMPSREAKVGPNGELVRYAFDPLPPRREKVVSFVRIDADKSKQLAQRYKVMGLPSYRFFKHGEEITSLRSNGGMNEKQFQTKIDSLKKRTVRVGLEKQPFLKRNK